MSRALLATEELHSEPCARCKFAFARRDLHEAWFLPLSPLLCDTCFVPARDHQWDPADFVRPREGTPAILCIVRQGLDRSWHAFVLTQSGQRGPHVVVRRSPLPGPDLHGGWMAWSDLESVIWGWGYPVCDDAFTREQLVNARGLDWFLKNAR